MENKKLAILMATYNGARYLQEQLDSLFSQTEKDWVLYVQDDGSKDATLSILEENQKEHGNLEVLTAENPGRGAKENFLNMLQRVEADYYMFCDQDDVWLPNKVETTLKRMQELANAHPGMPVALCTDLYVVDKDLKVIAPSFWAYSGIHPEYLDRFERLAVENLATGCTMMLNKVAKNATIFPAPLALMHDAWVVGCTCAAGGIVEAINEPLIYYRQHGANCLGAKSVEENTLNSKIKNFRDLWTFNKQQYKMFNAIRPISVWTYVKNKIQYRRYHAKVSKA